MGQPWIISLVTAAVLWVGCAQAQDRLATVADVKPQAVAGSGAEKVTLITGAQLREGETVVTGLNGEVQVIFSDQTHLVIGSGSSLIIERYLMRTDGTPQKFAINALAGTFRFITGNGEKSAYNIDTPTGTLGVRGTEFDFTVDRVTGHTNVILFEGGVKLCARSGGCVLLSERCSVGAMDQSDGAGLLTRESERRRIAGSEFPYLKSQFRLLREFRVLSPQQCAGPVKFAEEQPKKTSVVIEATSPPALPLPAPPTALPLAPPSEKDFFLAPLAAPPGPASCPRLTEILVTK